MASPYNTTDQMNSRSTGAQGTQISKTAQVGAISDANETSEHFDVNEAGDWEAAPQSAEQAPKRSASQKTESRSASTGKSQRDIDARNSSPLRSKGQSPSAAKSQPKQAEQNASGVDVLKGSLSNAFDQIVKEIEPQINEFASSFAHQAIAKGEDFGRVAIQRVQRQSWKRIALAGALFVGAIAVLGYEAAEMMNEPEDSDLH